MSTREDEIELLAKELNTIRTELEAPNLFLKECEKEADRLTVEHQKSLDTIRENNLKAIEEAIRKNITDTNLLKSYIATHIKYGFVSFGFWEFPCIGNTYNINYNLDCECVEKRLEDVLKELEEKLGKPFKIYFDPIRHGKITIRWKDERNCCCIF
jgi:hypothetical protein